jgi:formylglycine-generating enzyme required for sulfatase activity
MPAETLVRLRALVVLAAVALPATAWTADNTAPADAAPAPAASVTLFHEAFELQRAGNVAEAVVKYVDGLVIDPENPQAHLFLGEAYASLNDLPHARHQLEIAAALNTDAGLQERARRDLAALPAVPADVQKLLAEIQASMVPIDAATYSMGDPRKDAMDDAVPVHTVALRALRLAKEPVTFEQYDTYARAVGKALPDDRGWGRGRRPVLGISWDAARAFIAWLNKQGLEQYRLPTEAEWEFAARADPAPGVTIPLPATDASDEVESTRPVDEMPLNVLGIRGLIGGPLEWMQDCFHENYKGAPVDGSAWLGEECDRHEVRGGLARHNEANLLPYTRHWDLSNYRVGVRGFRLARDE